MNEVTFKPEDIFTQEEIDGTILTINADNKYRKSRVISPVKKYRRVQDIQGFLNYCRWRLGERSETLKPRKIFTTVLSNVKKGTIDNLSIGYREAYKDYQELIDSAANIDLRKVDNKSTKSIKKQKTPKKIVTKQKVKSLANSEFEAFIIQLKKFGISEITLKF